MKTFVRILLITVCIILCMALCSRTIYADERFRCWKCHAENSRSASLTAIPAAGIFAANAERAHMIAPEAHLRKLTRLMKSRTAS